MIIIGDQFFLARKIHAVFAGMRDRRSGNAHVNFLRSRFANELYQCFRRRTAYDGIIDNDNFLIPQYALDRIEFYLDLHLALILTGLDECSSDIVRANKSDLILRGIAFFIILRYITK